MNFDGDVCVSVCVCVHACVDVVMMWEYACADVVMMCECVNGCYSDLWPFKDGQGHEELHYYQVA